MASAAVGALAIRTKRRELFLRQQAEFEKKREQCVAQFDAADESKTGKLSKDELRVLVSKVLGQSEAELASTRGQAALDFVMHCLGDGELGIPKSRVANVVPRFYWFMQNSEESLEAFDLFDVDEPFGSLDRAQLKNVLDHVERKHGDPLYAVEAKEDDLDMVFERMDWSRNSRIERHEAVAAIAMWLEVAKERPGELTMPATSGCCVIS